MMPPGYDHHHADVESHISVLEGLVDALGDIIHQTEAIDVNNRDARQIHALMDVIREKISIMSKIHIEEDALVRAHCLSGAKR